MKIFRFLILGLAFTIALLVAIFGIETEDDTTVVVETTAQAPAESEPSYETTKPTQDTPLEVKIPNLSDAEKAAYPAFILAMPSVPDDGDENGNWLRDDIEIYIAYKFPYSPKSRAAYIQMAKILDRIGTDGGQTKTARQITLLKDELFARKCFFDSGFTDDDLSELKRIVLNNKHRIVGYQSITEIRKELPENLTSTIQVPEDACDPIIWENQATLQDWSPE